MDSEEFLYWYSEIPSKCQITGRLITDAFVYGAMPGINQWGMVHPLTFCEMGGTFGHGRGQLYEQQTDGRWLMVEG